jgi:hypothetical protein
VNFADITLSVASQLVFIVVSVYFVIDSVRKLLDMPSYWKHGDGDILTRAHASLSHYESE